MRTFACALNIFINQAVVLPELLLVTELVAEVVSQLVVHPVQESLLDSFPVTISQPLVEFLEPVVCVVSHTVVQLMAQPVAETASELVCFL
jgi:hypothetical protein